MGALKITTLDSNCHVVSVSDECYLIWGKKITEQGYNRNCLCFCIYFSILVSKLKAAGIQITTASALTI